jgi:hypothetical protein
MATFLNGAVWPETNVTLDLLTPNKPAKYASRQALALPSWGGACRCTVRVPSGATRSWLARALGLALRCRKTGKARKSGKAGWVTHLGRYLGLEWWLSS